MVSPFVSASPSIPEFLVDRLSFGLGVLLFNLRQVLTKLLRLILPSELRQALKCEPSAWASCIARLTDQAVSCLLLTPCLFLSLLWLVGRWRRDLPVVHASPWPASEKMASMALAVFWLTRGWPHFLHFFHGHTLGLCSHTLCRNPGICLTCVPALWTCHWHKGPPAPPCLSICLIYISLLLCSPHSMSSYFYWEEGLHDVSLGHRKGPRILGTHPQAHLSHSFSRYLLLSACHCSVHHPTNSSSCECA